MTQPPDPNAPESRPEQTPPPAAPPPSSAPPPPEAPPGYGQYGTTTAPPPAQPPPPGYGYGEYGGAAAPPPGMYYDQASGILLPQGVGLAPVGRRIGAYFLGILLMIVTLVIGYVIWGLVIWSRGQTPALSVLGMRVWHPDQNRPATWGRMALREIVGRFVEGILSWITELISFILFLTRKDRRCIHDLIAGTVVIHDPNKVLPT